MNQATDRPSEQDRSTAPGAGRDMASDDRGSAGRPSGKGPRASTAAPTGVALAMRASTELVVATLIGAGLGYGLDHWLGSRPWMTVLFLFFGAAAGIRNVYRIVNHPDLQSIEESTRKP